MKRRLRLTEGNSDKFWYIDVAEDQVTVRYGRTGTAGTTRTKQYESTDKALTDAEKQVAAKIKKGYTDDATASTEALEPTEATRTGTRKNETRPVGRVVAEPVSTPLEVSDLDADDLGLVITPFERAYDINAEVSIEVDDSPFDPEAELERAKRIVTQEKYSNGHSSLRRFRFTEPLFTTMPSRERIAWWVSHLEALEEARKKKYYADQTIKYKWNFQANIDWPTWLKVVLYTDWNCPLSEIVNHCRMGLLEDSLVLRAVLSTRTENETAEARAALPSPLHHDSDSWGDITFNNHTMFMAAGLDALSPDEARELMDAFPDNSLRDWNYALKALVLPTAEERVAFARRTGAGTTDWCEVIPWIVATGQKGFDLLVDWLGRGPRETASLMLQVAAEVGHGPGMTKLFLNALDSKAADVAAEWIRSHIPQALAANLTPAQANALTPFLRELPREQLRGVVKQTAGSTRAVIDEILTETTIPALPTDTSWWQDAIKTTKLPKAQKLPFSVDALPLVLVDEHRLDTTHMKQLMQALSDTERHPLTAEIHDRTDPANRDHLAVALLRLWLSAGAPAKLSWLMTGAGWLGGSEFVNTLAPMIREWPGASQHKRAVKGLTALRNVATDEALQQISGIAAKVKYASLKQHANQAMHEIAIHRGLTRDELEDRIIPDGGLDGRGTRVFDYGPRRFLAHVTSDGKLAARLLSPDGHPTGRVLSTLPAPNKSDDPERAKISKTEYGNIKKTVTALTKIQIKRFEQAMVQDRRWSPENHARFIASHPVLRRLLSAIIWGVYDAGNVLVRTARIDEDSHLVNLDDEAVKTKDCTIGIPHPLEMDDAIRAAWAEVLSDYEIVQSFKQLDRLVLRLPDDQGDDMKLHGLPEGKFPAGKLVGAFAKYGWERGSALDNGAYCIHALTIPTAGLTAVIRYTGMAMGIPIAEQEDQEIEEAYILQGHHDPKNLGWGYERDTKGLERIPWSRVPPRITSEVLAALKEMSNT